MGGYASFYPVEDNQGGEIATIVWEYRFCGQGQWNALSNDYFAQAISGRERTVNIRLRVTYQPPSGGGPAPGPVSIEHTLSFIPADGFDLQNHTWEVEEPKYPFEGQVFLKMPLTGGGFQVGNSGLNYILCEKISYLIPVGKPPAFMGGWFDPSTQQPQPGGLVGGLKIDETGVIYDLKKVAGDSQPGDIVKYKQTLGIKWANNCFGTVQGPKEIGDLIYTSTINDDQTWNPSVESP